MIIFWAALVASRQTTRPDTTTTVPRVFIFSSFSSTQLSWHATRDISFFIHSSSPRLWLPLLSAWRCPPLVFSCHQSLDRQCLKVTFKFLRKVLKILAVMLLSSEQLFSEQWLFLSNAPSVYFRCCWLLSLSLSAVPWLPKLKVPILEVINWFCHKLPSECF